MVHTSQKCYQIPTFQLQSVFYSWPQTCLAMFCCFKFKFFFLQMTQTCKKPVFKKFLVQPSDRLRTINHWKFFKNPFKVFGCLHYMIIKDFSLCLSQALAERSTVTQSLLILNPSTLFITIDYLMFVQVSSWPSG